MRSGDSRGADYPFTCSRLRLPGSVIMTQVLPLVASPLHFLGGTDPGPQLGSCDLLVGLVLGRTNRDLRKNLKCWDLIASWDSRMP